MASTFVNCLNTAPTCLNILCTASTWVVSFTQAVLSTQLILWHLDDFDKDVQVRPTPPPPPSSSHIRYSDRQASGHVCTYIQTHIHEHTFSLSFSLCHPLSRAHCISLLHTNAHSLQASRHVDLCAQPWVLQFCATCIFLTLMLNNVPVLPATLFIPALSLSQPTPSPLSPSLTPTVPWPVTRFFNQGMWNSALLCLTSTHHSGGDGVTLGNIIQKDMGDAVLQLRYSSDGRSLFCYISSLHLLLLIQRLLSAATRWSRAYASCSLEYAQNSAPGCCC